MIYFALCNHMEYFLLFISLNYQNPTIMKRKYFLTVFILIIAATAFITLTSGVEKRYGGGKDIVEELYDHAVKQDDNLQDIEEGIEKFYKKKDEALEKYNSYTNYNNRYYAEAKSNAAGISDAATKQRTLDLVSKSEASYYSKMTNWQNQTASLNTQEKELRDLHVLLQVMISIQSMEKYQQSAFPDNSKLKETNADLKQVIEKIKAITK